MAKLLEVAQLAHEHGVAEVKIGGGWVESCFDAEGATGFERVFQALAEVSEADDFGGAFLEQVELVRNWWKCDGWEGGHVEYKYKVAGACGLGKWMWGLRSIIFSMSYRNHKFAALFACIGPVNVASAARAAAAAA
jgi:hypothetical protein